MQLMRQDMEIRRYNFSLLLQIVHSVPNFAGQIIMHSSKLVESDCQKSESLVDVVVKLSGYACSFLLLCLDQLSGHTGEFFFRLLPASNVLREDENPSHSTFRGLPRTNLPACPMSAVLPIPTVFVRSEGFSLKAAAVNLFPTLGHIWKNLIVGTP